MHPSQAEECADPAIKVPRALAFSVPVGFTAGLFFVIPICVTRECQPIARCAS